MAIDYKYSLEKCDVKEVRRAKLDEYRKLRSKCLESIQGEASSSITNQVHQLTWHTLVFQTLNEARRIESNRKVNGAMWELIVSGYANLICLGVRKLVDKDKRTDSIKNVIYKIKQQQKLFTRENYVCFDGLPFDYETVFKTKMESRNIDSNNIRPLWLDKTGPEAWSISKQLHHMFDNVTGHTGKRSPLDEIQGLVFDKLLDHLDHPAIKKVCELVDREIAHSEQITNSSRPVPNASYEEVNTALHQIVRVTNFISSNLFFDTAFGSVVMTPQFDVLEGLEVSWVLRENKKQLYKHWEKLTDDMNNWAYDSDEEFLPKTNE